METLWQDPRFAGRMLRKSRGFTAIALVTLAVGIGANTIMFSVVNALLFRPPHVKKPDQLVRCGVRNISYFTYATYANIRDDNPVFSDLAAHSYGAWPGTWVRGDVAKQMELLYVSANYFSALGVTPAYGRTFLPEEEPYGAEPVVVLSYRTWERQGAEPGIVGQFVNISAKPCRIVGVMPKGFTGTSAGGPDLWLPLGAYGPVAHYDGVRPAGRIREIWDYPQVVLVMLATLFTRTARKAADANPGFDLAGKVVVQIDPLAAGYTRAQAATACATLAERLKALPGIQAAGLSTGYPVGDARAAGGARWFAPYEPGVENDPSRNLLGKGLSIYQADTDYFAALGIPILRGRVFHPLDRTPGTEKVVIIDEQLARKLRPDGNAVDCLIQHGLSSEVELQVCRVIGVVPSLRTLSGEVRDWPHMYEPLRADQVPGHIHLRVTEATPQTEAALVQSIGAQIRKLDPRLPVVSVTSLVDQHRQGYAVRQVGVTAKLATMFGTMALFLAGLGLYAVKGHMVASQTPEIGIRMAFGATRGDVVRMVFLQGAVSTFVGLSTGILLAAALARVVRAGLHGISPLDPVSIASTMALLAAVSVLAGYVPARRATRIDPMEALRYE